MEMTKLADGVFEVVERYVDRRFSMLMDRIKVLEAREIPAGIAGSPGEPGERGEPGIAGKDGAPGADGKDGEAPSLEVLAVLIAGEVAKQVAAIKVKDGTDGRDGKDGINGKDGTDGRDGKDGINGKDGAPGRDADPEYISKLVQASVAALPKPSDGKDGLAGKDGADGQDGKDAEVDYGLIVRKVLAEIPEPRDGRDGQRGQKGEPGRDGFGFDDVTAEMVDGRHVAIKFQRGEDVKAFKLRFPNMLYQGVYEQKAYEAQDSVTYGGALWIAKRDVSAAERPADSDAWQLAVKRGRDGKA